jgi:uncharacterized membrane protein
VIQVTVFSRADCHLCDDVLEDLRSLEEEYPHEVIVLDIDGDKKLQQKYREIIPVVIIGPYQLKAPITRQQLAIALGAAVDGVRHRQTIAEAQQQKRVNGVESFGGPEKLSLWITRHYLAIFNLFFLLYAGLPFLGPVLLRSGADAPARLIYNSYSLMCHQLAFRSVFMFGEQIVYPRASAGIDGLITYEQATGNDPDDLITARQYLGDETIGYKVALCQRDVAIYLGIFLFGVAFSLTGRRLPALPWYLWIVIGILPMGLDGVSQYISQLPFGFTEALVPFRESTPLLRYMTGLLFGIGTAWFGYPLVEATMRDSRSLLQAKAERIARQQSNEVESKN